MLFCMILIIVLSFTAAVARSFTLGRLVGGGYFERLSSSEEEEEAIKKEGRTHVIAILSHLIIICSCAVFSVNHYS